MSKTVEELRSDYNRGFWSVPEAEGLQAQQNAGIAAVIRALRDELNRVDWDLHESAIEVLDGILDSDAGEKVAGRVGETKHPDVTSPATAPAPAVCEWTQTAVAYWRAGCHASAGPMCAIESETCVQKCTLCQRPIKFTEAK